MKHAIRLSILATSLCAVATAQPARTFAKPDAEFAEPFSQVASVRELGDGRVIVLDTRENTLQLIDFKGGAASAVGRQGSGPGEWQRPTALYALLGDSTLVQDPQNGRFLIVGPNAKGTRVFKPVGGTGGILRAVDARGHMYYQGPSVLLRGGSEPAYVDSVPVIRYDPTAESHDTLAYVQIAKPRLGAPQTTSGGQARIVGGVIGPFDPADDWTVLADGRLVVSRVADYHIEIRAPNAAPIIGAAIPFTRHAVTDGDKEAWRAARRGITPTVRRSDGQAATLPANFQLPEPHWAASKPAFGSGATRAAPNGEIWVLRNRAHGDSIPVFDVFDVAGRATGRAILPKGTALVGFGVKSAYLVRSDADGFQYLQRYSLK